jgi:predicted GIY-YIG superfamily endonuclease
MYVYLLQSESEPNQRYIGLTKYLSRRLQEHNAGKSKHTSKFIPWRVVATFWLDNPEKAAAFETYLKRGSGHAFARKHFW